MDKIKILVVDDHAIMRDGIRALLTLYDDIEMVGEASDGKEAIDKVQQLAPDVVVMDLTMPRMDGFEAIRRITQKYPKVKILVLSQHDDKEYTLAAIKAGARGYVPKRALSSELISAMRVIHQGDFFLSPSAASSLIEAYRQQSKEEPYDRLTDREREILKLVADGHTSREIAKMLSISLKTVLIHRTNLMHKLDLHNSAELIKYSIQKGLVNISI